MILDLIILISSGLIGLISWVFDKVTVLVPTGIQESVIYAFGYLNVFRGVFPIATLMICVSFILYVYLGKYGIKLFFKFIWPLIPFFGKNQIVPFSDNTVNLSNQPNQLNLHKSKGRHIMKSTRDIR